MKNYLKRILAVVLAAVMTFSLVACNNMGNVKDNDDEETTKKVVTTTEFDETTQESSEVQTQEPTEPVDPAKAAAEQASFDEYCDQLFLDLVGDSYLNVHYAMEDPAKFGVEVTDYTLGNYTLSEIEEGETQVKDALAKLNQFDERLLTDRQVLTYKSLKAYLERLDAFCGLSLPDEMFGTNSGIMSNLPTEFIEFVFDNEEDVIHYLDLVKDTKRYLGQILDFLDYQYENGYYLASFEIEGNIETIDKYLEIEVNPMLASFEEKLETLDLSADKKAEYIALNEEYVADYYDEAYRMVKEKMLSLADKETNDKGLWSVELGDELYAAIVRKKTSTNMTPAELATYLDNELDNLFTSARQILLSDMFIDTKYSALDCTMTDTTEILKFLADSCEEAFPTPITKDFVVQYQSKATEVEGTLAYYLQARLDRLDYNSIKVNGSAVEGKSLMLYSTLAHEGFPGHLYQFTNVYGNPNVPKVISQVDFIGFTEGYAEYASDRMYRYLGCDENLIRYTVLNDIFGYILESRVDVGANYEGWDVDDAYDYLAGFGIDDRDTAEEIYEMVVSNPGLLLPYTVGHLKMTEYRERAMSDLGDKFDEKAYHQFIIDLGFVSFEIMEEEYTKFVNDTLSGKTTSTSVVEPTTEAPTEEPTEEPTEAPVVAYTNTEYTYGNLTVKFPFEMEYYTKQAETYVFHDDKTNMTLAIFAQLDNTVDADMMLEAYASAAENVYGGTYKATVERSLYDNGEMNFLCVNVIPNSECQYSGACVVYAEGSTVLYMEYITVDREVDLQPLLDGVSLK